MTLWHKSIITAWNLSVVTFCSIAHPVKAPQFRRCVAGAWVCIKQSSVNYCGILRPRAWPWFRQAVYIYETFKFRPNFLLLLSSHLYQAHHKHISTWTLWQYFNPIHTHIFHLSPPALSYTVLVNLLLIAWHRLPGSVSLIVVNKLGYNWVSYSWQVCHCSAYKNFFRVLQQLVGEF